VRLSQSVGISAHVAGDVIEQDEQIVVDIGGHRRASSWSWGRAASGGLSGGSPVRQHRFGGRSVNVAEHQYADNKHAYEIVKPSFASQHCVIGMAGVHTYNG
jgi:hypothetical protein